VLRDKGVIYLYELRENFTILFVQRVML
jgi:hypothetical protein